jgi:LysM repeat protein
MLMNKCILYLIFTFYTFLVDAQEYVPITLVNGKKYYNHFVIEGNTIYSIQKMYDCPAEEILNANEGIERGLDYGKLILIPAIPKTISHIVQKNETLSFLSRFYSVSIDTIIKYNIDSKIKLNIGQNLLIVGAIIPVKNSSRAIKLESTILEANLANSNKLNSDLTASDSLIFHTVLPNETLYTISKRFLISKDAIQKLNNLKSSDIVPGKVIKIPLKINDYKEPVIRTVQPQESNLNNNLKNTIFQAKENYSIALFLPFNIDSIPTFNKNISNAALEYYMGVNLAIKTFDKRVKTNFYVYDYLAKDYSIQEHLETPLLKSMDLIFAPFQEKEAKIVYDWSKKNKVRVLFSGIFVDNFLIGNENSFALTANDNVMVEMLAKELVLNHTDEQIILIKSEKKEESSIYEHFLASFRSQKSVYSKPKVIEATINNYKLFEKLGKKTYYVFLSKEKDNVLSLLNYCKDKSLIKVFGLNDWIEFKEVNSVISNKFSFYYITPTFFSFTNPELIDFHKSFRVNYTSDLTKTSCFGYDNTNFALNFLCTGKLATNGLISKFSFVQTEFGNGYQNTECFLLKFEDFESKIGVINE